MLWQYLSECGYQDYHLEYIWQQIEDAVIKTILVALPEMRKEFHEMETISAYNTYKILGSNHLLLWKANLSRDMNGGGFVFSRFLNGTFPRWN